MWTLRIPWMVWRICKVFITKEPNLYLIDPISSYYELVESTKMLVKTPNLWQMHDFSNICIDDFQV